MKEFKSIGDQIAILESRGMMTGGNARVILLRENYYSVVNGYKDPFLNREAMRSNADDVYLPGTKLEWLYNLFLFDRELRQITFSYLIQAEAALKTATVYSFCERNREPDAYLDRASFCSAKDMLVPKSFRGDKFALHANNLNRLMKTLNGKLVIKGSTRPFVSHYLKVYGSVPLWVLANDLTFGNMAHFFQLMKRGEQNSVCKHLFETTLRFAGDKRITPHEVLRAYDVLTQFRNLCAHDERLYCARFGNDTYSTMLKLMDVAIPKAMVDKLKSEIRDLLDRYENNLHVITATDLRIQLGLMDK